MVEVTKLNLLQRPFADPLLEQQVEREPVAAVVLREDRPLLVGGEGRPLDAALAWWADRPRRIAMQLPAQCRPLEEALQDRDVLRPRA